jgi:hypothetical protein
MRNKILALVTLVVVCVIVGTVACTTTVTPVQIKDTVHSYDGTNQNSGFIGSGTNGCGYITPHARDRYNGYIEIYGKRFIPPLVCDEGLKYIATSNVWEIDQEHLVKFGVMNQWRKSGK